MNLILAGGMGRRALGLFEEQNIRVITGVPSLAPEELIQRVLEWLSHDEAVCVITDEEGEPHEQFDQEHDGSYLPEGGEELGGTLR